LDYQSKRDVLEQAEGKQDQPSENGAAESGKKRKWDKDEQSEKESKFVTGVPLTTMPGHTGYLTFSTLPPVL